LRVCPALVLILPRFPAMLRQGGVRIVSFWLKVLLKLILVRLPLVCRHDSQASTGSRRRRSLPSAATALQDLLAIAYSVPVRLLIAVKELILTKHAQPLVGWVDKVGNSTWYMIVLLAPRWDLRGQKAEWEWTEMVLRMGV